MEEARPRLRRGGAAAGMKAELMHEWNRGVCSAVLLKTAENRAQKDSRKGRVTGAGESST